MADAVYDELAAAGLPPGMGALLRDRVISVESCEDGCLKPIKDAFPTLGPGELGSICIAAGYKARKFSGYLFLTDDASAQKKAGSLGINSLDSSQFVLFLNEKRVCPKQAAKDTLERLNHSVYGIGPEAMGDCLRRLR